MNYTARAAMRFVIRAARAFIAQNRKEPDQLTASQLTIE
jgi:hypothetical protein